MKRIRQANGYTIYQATTQRDADNYNCEIGNYNVYIAQDIRDYGLANSYPEWENEDSLAVVLARCNGSQYAVACALADELSNSTVQDMDMVLEIERRLENGEALNAIREELGPCVLDDGDDTDLGDMDVAFDSEDWWADTGLDEDDLDGDLEDVFDRAMAEADRPRSHASYAVLRDPDTGDHETIAPPHLNDTWCRKPEDANMALLSTVAKHYAFSDCGGWDVEEIVIDGDPVEYAGWRPGMEFVFTNCRTGEIIYDRYHDEWDH